jgi:RNA polymerase sigma factor (sigma-70 family)
LALDATFIRETKMTASPDKVLDAYLVAAARCGDAAAFDALVRRWHNKLLAHAWRLIGDKEAARDAVQDGWTDIAQGLTRLQEEKAFSAWAYRIVSRKCARRIVGMQQTRALGAALAAEPVDEVEEAAADVERLRAAIRALPGPQRAAVALFYFEELSVAEIAVALDVPAGTVKTRLMHARQKLRSELEGVT